MHGHPEKAKAKTHKSLRAAAAKVAEVQRALTPGRRALTALPGARRRPGADDSSISRVATAEAALPSAAFNLVVTPASSMASTARPMAASAAPSTAFSAAASPAATSALDSRRGSKEKRALAMSPIQAAAAPHLGNWHTVPSPLFTGGQSAPDPGWAIAGGASVPTSPLVSEAKGFARASGAALSGEVGE